METTRNPRVADTALDPLPQWGAILPAISTRTHPVALELPRVNWRFRAANPAVIATALALVVATIAMAASNQHANDFVPGNVARAVRAAVPLAAGLVAGYAVFRPWRAILLVLLLAPVWNAAQVSWMAGPIQVILQTNFVAALLVGTWRWRRSNVPEEPAEAADEFEEEGWASARWRFKPISAIRAWAAGFTAYRFAEVAAGGFVFLAILSTMNSADPVTSATVLLHGIAEPIGLGAIVVLLRPSRRDLIALAVVLGASAAIGGILDLLQMLPGTTSLAALQVHRLLIGRVAYFNIGLYGVVVAGVIPLLVGVFGYRRLAHMDGRFFGLMVVILCGCLVGLFLTFSKSAYLAATAGSVLALLLLVGTWRRRVTIVLAAAAVSAILIPWPALVLQPFPALASAYRSADVALIGESRFDSWNPATLAGHGSMAERYYAVEGGVKMGLDYPVLGVGLDQFSIYYAELGYKPPEQSSFIDHAHSLFPEIGAELGLPAMALLAMVFLATLWAIRAAYRRRPDRTTRALAAGLAAGIIAWIIAGSAFGVDIYRTNRALSTDVVVAAVLVGAAIALARGTMRRRHPETIG